jgi:hypothetical protein
MKLDFCKACGRIVLRGFSYCPYCGMALHGGPDIEEALDSSFSTLEVGMGDQRDRRIRRLLKELSALEIDMDEILHSKA